MTTADVPRNERPPFRLADEERADLHAAVLTLNWPHILAHVADLCESYHAAGLVEGDMGHDGTIQAEVAS